MAPGAYPYSLSALLARTRRDETLRRQQEDETLRCIAREHPIFYIGSVVPLLLASLFLALVVWFETERVLPNSVYAVLYVIGGLAVVGSVAYGVYRIFELWWLNVYLITDKRVLVWRACYSPRGMKLRSIGCSRSPWSSRC